MATNWNGGIPKAEHAPPLHTSSVKLETERGDQCIAQRGVATRSEHVLEIGLKREVLTELEEICELEGCLAAAHGHGIVSLQVGRAQA